MASNENEEDTDITINEAANQSSVFNGTATGTFKILCISYESEKLGAACYEEFGQTIYYLHDTIDDENFNTLKYLLDRLKPTHVIANSSSSKRFRAILQAQLKCNLEDLTITMNEKTMEFTANETSVEEIPEFEPGVTAKDLITQPEAKITAKITAQEATVQPEVIEEDSDDSMWFASLQLLPRSCFSVDEGKKWLKRIFGNNGHNSSLRAKLLFDTEEMNMMSAMGALLRHINQLQIGMDLDPNSFVAVSSFKQINLGDIMDVDNSTVKALEIFESLNDFMGSKITRKYTIGKRGLKSECLFDFCNMCKSATGKRKLKAWFSRPIRSRDILKLRLDGVSFFNQDCNVKFTHYIRSKLRHVSSLTGVITRMRLAKSPVADWRNVLRTIGALIAIGDALREYEVKLPILGPGEKALGVELARLHTLLTETFNHQESVKEERFVVNAGISEELDELKATHEQLGDCLTEVAEHEINNYNLRTCSVCYLPIIGYMVLVPSSLVSDLDDTEIEMVYTTEQSIGFKTPVMHQLDQKFGDIRSKIIDHETLISNSLQELFVKRRKAIFDGIEVASTLDCLISLAMVAHEYDWCRPYFIDEPIIDVENARHPVTEKICKGRYMPNPIKSADPKYGLRSSKVKLITGPNASGKSIYLKMIGSIIYLAHVGSFVPADRARFGPINRLMSRMYTIDSVLSGLSSFGSDMKQMADAVCKADENSVIIIDEFGKGTMTEVGLSLLASCMNYWLENEDKCPHVFVCTHFHSLPNLLHESRLISNNMMKVTTEDKNELDFTYEFIDGLCTHSYANYIAQKMGIKREIIERAEEVSEVLKTGQSLNDIPPVNQDDENQMKDLADRMETLLDDFFTWDMQTDPIGFLRKANAILRPDHDTTDSRLEEDSHSELNLDENSF